METSLKDSRDSFSTLESCWPFFLSGRKIFENNDLSENFEWQCEEL